MVFLLLLILFVNNLQVYTKPSSGPFVSKPFRLQTCEKPSKPYVKNPTLVVKVEFYNVSNKIYMRGNFTVIKDEARKIWIRVRYYRREGDKWKILHMINSGGCRGMVASTVMLALGIEYDSRRCSGPVGVRHFDKIDINKIEHRWSSTREYGHFLWVNEVRTTAATYMCFQYETLVTPLKDSGKGYQPNVIQGI